ncbi:MAG: hypothetical protein WBB43_20920 [Limnoraphis sp.]
MVIFSRLKFHASILAVRGVIAIALLPCVREALRMQYRLRLRNLVSLRISTF